MTEFGTEKNGPSGSAMGQARGLAEEMKGAARDVAQEARAAGTALRDEAAGLGSTIKQGLTDQVERQKNGIADRLSLVAQRVHETGSDLRENEAWLGNLLGRGAEELENVAEEIRRNDIPGILGSVEVFARRQPAVFMGATVALGFALTRFVSGGPTTADNYGRDAGHWDAGRWDVPTRYPDADIGAYSSRSEAEPMPRGRPAPTVGGSNA